MDHSTKIAEAVRVSEEPFAQRLMKVPAGGGTRRPTTWQQSHLRDARFNAHGCL